MAHGVSVIARILSKGTGDTPDLIAFDVSYDVSDNRIASGSVLTQVLKTATDQEMESSMRAQVAAHLAELTGDAFTEEDVRGCKI